MIHKYFRFWAVKNATYGYQKAFSLHFTLVCACKVVFVWSGASAKHWTSNLLSKDIADHKQEGFLNYVSVWLSEVLTLNIFPKLCQYILLPRHHSCSYHGYLIKVVQAQIKCLVQNGSVCQLCTSDIFKLSANDVNRTVSHLIIQISGDMGCMYSIEVSVCC